MTKAEKVFIKNAKYGIIIGKPKGFPKVWAQKDPTIHSLAQQTNMMRPTHKRLSRAEINKAVVKHNTPTKAGKIINRYYRGSHLRSSHILINALIEDAGSFIGSKLKKVKLGVN